MYQFAGTFLFPNFELVATDGVPVSPATVIGRGSRGEATEGIGTSVLRPPVLRTVRSPIGGVDDAKYSVWYLG